MRWMGPVTLLLAAQLGVSGFLFSRVAAVDQEIGALHDRLGILVAARTGERVPGDPGIGGRPGQATLDEAHLREIIRHELDQGRVRLADSPPQAASARSGGPSGNTGEVPGTPPDVSYQRRLEDVEQRLTYYVQTGRITPTEMARLQSDVAGLRPPERRAMVSRLVKALNEGVLKARL